MAKRRSPAKEVAKRRGGGYWIDHAAIAEEDISWLEAATELTLWNVTVPPGFLGGLPHLVWLDIRGGSAETLAVKEARGLHYLSVNQVRGLADLTEIVALSDLRYLSVYGLAHVQELPSLKRLESLTRADVGQIKVLQSIGPVLDAPNLKELLLLRKIPVSPSDVQRIQQHARLEAFDWFAEDVPIKLWKPVLEQIRLPRTRIIHPEEWFAMRVDDAGKPLRGDA